MVNIASAIMQASVRLKTADIPQATREATSLLRHAIKKNQAFIIAHPEYELTADEQRDFSDSITRRERREPFQLIVGHQEFYGLDFDVRRGILIPRPETETLVERAIEILSELEKPTIFEAGVGTGCIIISILNAIKSATAVGVDISEEAISLAASNAETHGVDERLTIRKADLFTGVDSKFEMIVSNPPYVPESDSGSLQPEVIEFDPREALFAGPDGLDVIRRIADEAPAVLVPEGYLLMEFGFGQRSDVEKIFQSSLWADIKIISDLQGIPRTLVARRGYQ